MDLENSRDTHRRSRADQPARRDVATPDRDLLAECLRYLDHGQLREALGVVNARTRFRFTGAYRFEPPMLRSFAVYDRENPALAVRAEVPILESYCSLIAASEGEVAFDDAAADHRAAAHAARARYTAYCGVPLRRVDGSIFGTLCHFDPRPRIGSAEELALLAALAPHLASRLASD